MIKLIKSFRFWFALLSILIITQNMLGWDDKNLLLYFTTPPIIMINEWFYSNWSVWGKYAMLFFYVCNFLTWFLAGFLLDRFVNRLVRKLRRRG